MESRLRWVFSLLCVLFYFSRNDLTAGEELETTAAIEEGEKTGGEEQELAEKEEEAEAEEEEEEGDEETVFLPTGDNKDFRLFRAKLRAGSDEKWQEQLKRNVNVGQLAGQDAWAHELSAPEKGCLIVAKSTEFSTSQTYFNEVQ